MRESAKTKE
jgi:ankyrin repeat protein